MLSREGGTTFLSEHRVGKEKLHPTLVSHVDNSDRVSHKAYLGAFDGIAALRPRMDEIASRYAAILTPSVPDKAPIGLENTGSYAFCKIWTALHTPVLNVPGFKGGNGLPIGLSLVVPRYRDGQLLRVGNAVGQIFESEDGWRRQVHPADEALEK